MHALRKVFLKAISKTQLFILAEIKANESTTTLTQLLRLLSKRNKIPLSTLKDASRKLKELGLIEYGSCKEFRVVKLTDAGKFVLSVLTKDWEHDSVRN